MVFFFATVLVNISDSHQISCTLFGAGIEDPSLDEYLSTVLKRYGFITYIYRFFTVSEDDGSRPPSI